MNLGTINRVQREVAQLREQVRPTRSVGTAVGLAGELGIVPDPWQAEALDSTERQMILLCCRQAGKSTVAAVLGLHEALSRRGALVLIVSPGERQSKRLFRRLVGFYRALGRPVPADVDNRLSLELANGAEVHALPGKEATVRGFAGVDLLLIDEAARVPDDLYMAVRPMVAVSGGRVLLMSTPFGKRGFFAETWAGDDPGWHRIEITAHDVPRIDPAWLAAERARIGDWWFDQEYLCLFKDAVDSYFRSEDIEAMASPDIEPLFGPGYGGPHAA